MLIICFNALWIKSEILFTDIIVLTISIFFAYLVDHVITFICYHHIMKFLCKKVVSFSCSQKCETHSQFSKKCIFFVHTEMSLQYFLLKSSICNEADSADNRLISDRIIYILLYKHTNRPKCYSLLQYVTHPPSFNYIIIYCQQVKL